MPRKKARAPVTGTTGSRRTGTSPGVGSQDHELLQVYAIFKAIDAELDQLVGCDAAAPEQKFISLHNEWNKALSRATTLPARTVEGQRVKAAILLAAMTVVLGPEHRGAAPHEILAASLARDLTG
jgi:hypothetical protein